ncbi:MAG: Gfo/Idh/MocA family oxidoreductase, partial [Actinomycetota bacterium]|nr:Gfo/Idh/MocA family oxidoreductase [Actinomycetota bacterium]
MTIEAVMIGAGQRGHHVYGRWALEHPDQLRFVAVADPDPGRLERFAEPHRIPRERCFLEPLELLESAVLAPAAVIASPDRCHRQHAEAALTTGYQVLAEKPMADSLDGCRALVKAAADSAGTLHIGHVLRFTPFFNTLNEVVRSGRLGDIVTVEH